MLDDNIVPVPWPSDNLQNVRHQKLIGTEIGVALFVFFLLFRGNCSKVVDRDITTYILAKYKRETAHILLLHVVQISGQPFVQAHDRVNIRGCCIRRNLSVLGPLELDQLVQVQVAHHPVKSLTYL